MAFVVLFIGLFLPGFVYSGLVIAPLDLIDNCQSFETGSDLSYNWVLPRLNNDVKFIKFEVRAEHGALIGLSRQNMVLDSMYEIEIGADFNSRTIIRRCHQCTAAATDNKPGRLSITEPRVFWILSYQGIVAVGSDSSLEPFLVWIDRHPLEINHIGFTSDGVGGWWKFSKYPGTFTSTTTGDNCVLYPFVKLPNGNFEIEFSIKWTGTAALELAKEQKSKNCYYIVLTHAESDLSAEIRFNEQTLISTTYSPSQPIESDNPADFYVRVVNNNLQIGEQYMEPFLELPGVNATFIRHLGYSSFISDSADWYFPDMIPDVIGYTESLSEAEDCLCYRDIQVFYTDGESASLFAIHGYLVGEYQLEFKLKAEGRARIMLTDSTMGSTDRYNIVFDDGHSSGNNQTSYISLNGEVLQSIHNDLLSSSTNRPFYIRYTQEKLSVGHEGNPPMLTVEDVPYDAVQYIRFQTEHGEKGRWTFYDVQVESTVGLEPVPHDTHVYSYHTSGPAQPIYPFAPLSSEKFEFIFDVQSGGNAFVSLSPLPIDQKSYMFVFDRIANEQTSSVVLCDHQVFDEDKDSLLSKNEFTKIYIRRQESVLLAGKVGEDPILEIQGVVEPPPRFINFGNLNGDATQWRFYNVSPAARGEVSIYLQALGAPVYDLQIPPGDFMFLFSAMVTDVTYLFFSSEPKYEQGVGYKLTFANADSVGTSRVDVAFNGVAIASYSGKRLSLGDRAYLFVQLVDSALSIGISGEDAPLLHLLDVDRDSLKFIGLQRATTGIDMWTFFGLKYIGEKGHDDRVKVTDKPTPVPDKAPEPSTEPRQPIITREPPPEGNATGIDSGAGSSGSGQPGGTIIDAVGDGNTVPAVEPPNYHPPIEMSGDIVNVTTDGVSGYINKIGPLDLAIGSRGQFSVKAEKNVAVALISHNGSDTDYYEMLIGTDGNLKTELKRCVDSVCYTVMSEDTPYILKSIKKTLFFIEVIPSIDGLLKIRLGKGDVLDIESTTLLSYEDSDPLKIEYVGIRTYEVSGDWTIHHKILLPEDLTFFETGAGESVHYFPLAHHVNSLLTDSKPEGVSRFEFAVTSQSAVTLSISADRGDQPDRYVIRIGIDGNRKVSLYRCEATNCTLLETALESGVLNLIGPTSFFLELSTIADRALFIRLGKVGGIDWVDRKLLLYTIPRPLRVAFVGFSTPNSVGSWAINEFILYDIH
ncbi:uncharacterized protein LOC100893146 [Strongylocentrotus purpuratus]|uniref:Farnesoic acid O-methyl transferase domain-containing protein n=1 Tax=Strongylocentrotus purpuratus TaxID=7668 RepID=A0A7M7N2V6_STRPU|nr:uncharacterized protein LOC100893146 [Strongylocentrotus purpuratus]